MRKTQPAQIKATPFKEADLGTDVDYMALPPALIDTLLNDFTWNERGNPVGSIGVANCGLVATDRRNIVVVGELSQTGYRTTDSAKVMLESAEAKIYSRPFDATPLIPGLTPDEHNKPSTTPYPDVAKIVDRLNVMEFLIELPPDVLKRMAKVASSVKAGRIRILRSVDDPNVFGFQCTMENPSPAFGEANTVPIMGIVAGSKREEGKQGKEKKETKVINLEFASGGPSLNTLIRFVLEKGQISTSMLQREYRVGFQTADALIKQLAERKVIGEKESSRPRQCLITAETIGEYLEPEKEQREALEFEMTRPVGEGELLPSVNLLTQSEVMEVTEDTETPKHRINEILRDFSVDGGVASVNVGPTITRFEVSLGAKQAVSKVTKLADDIQMRMEAPGVRIAMIPGKAAIGIELPNQKTRTVRIREVLNEEFYGTKGNLVAALGVTVDGKPVYIDIAKMPHLLIAGATNSGKSVGLTAMISSLLMKMAPSELRLMLIDPKRVELMPFNGIPHLVTPVITESDQAIEALEKMCNVMDERYKLLEQTGVRNIDSYNEKHPENKLPFVLTVIDELADFILTGDKERAEQAIVRLAQKARAVGIHLVIATQRPSVEVITGTIKANILSRISFAVASQIDSRTILDGKGAESLLGRGDMLYMFSGAPIQRVQGCFISEGEVEDLCKHWRNVKA